MRVQLSATGSMVISRFFLYAGLLSGIRGRCPPGSMYGGSFRSDRCYFFGYSPLTRDEAINACNARNADLITIRGPADENVIMKSNDFYQPDNFLIGAFKFADRSINGVAPNTWKWVDDSPFNYTNWQNGTFWRRIP